MNARSVNLFAMVLLAVTAVGFSGCNSGMGGGSGVLNLAISDTPVDGATSVVVTFTGVEIQPAGAEDDNSDAEDMGSDDQGGSMGMMGSGDTDSDSSSGTSSGNQRIDINFSTPRQIDLMQQQGGNSASLLSGVTLPAGNYAWIRLKVDASQSTITLMDGTVHPLTIPSGDETGLKLVEGFTVAAGGVVNFTIDFDLRESITLANGVYILKPVLRLINNEMVGGIAGSVSNTVIIGTTAISDPSCGPAAYLYSGDNVTPVDINTTSTVQPVTTATLKLNSDTGNYDYMAPFLAAGDYTVTVTCAASDNPATVDALVFLTPKNATVTAGSTATVDFP